ENGRGGPRVEAPTPLMVAVTTDFAETARASRAPWGRSSRCCRAWSRSSARTATRRTTCT
ncbi:unnamed protein product, partial [Prorocentrum cordatum]